MLTHEQIMILDTFVAGLPEHGITSVQAVLKQENCLPTYMGIMSTEKTGQEKFTHLVSASALMYQKIQSTCEKLQMMIDDCEKAAAFPGNQAPGLLPFFNAWLNELLLIQRIALVGAQQSLTEALNEQKSLTASQSVRKL